MVSQSRLGSFCWLVSDLFITQNGRLNDKLTIVSSIRCIQPMAENIRPRHILREGVIVAIFIQPLSEQRHIN